MTELVTIGAVTTPVISYHDQRVCTAQQLAQFYGVDPENIHDNHRKTRDRFAEGVHFFKVSGKLMQDFVGLQPESFRSQISSKARSLILWTERGAARHAKMLSTDKAWDVFEQMEDAYFTVSRKPVIADGAARSTKYDRLPLYHFAVESVVKHRLLFSKVYTLINLYAGSRCFGEMTKEQSAEVADFCDRFAIGGDTRNDWQRITDNQTKLHGEPMQLDMVQRLLLLT